MDIQLDDIENAYRKLKSYVYYDKTLKFLRAKLAKFEYNEVFENRLKKLTQALKNKNDNYFEKLIKNENNDKGIDYKLIPKKINNGNEDENDKNKKSVITNNFESDIYTAKRYKYLIDAPIEIHIIAVLWIIKAGYKLDDSVSENSYGYRLEKSKITGKVKKGLKLFKPYFYPYKKWRDNAIDNALKLSKQDKDAAILSLDIKNFFRSVRLSFDEVHNELEKYEYLTDLIEKICREYTRIVEGKELDKPLLPIGLLSSSILANWYLEEFDTKIEEELNPVYYGRYVDDILIVLSNPVINNKNKPLQSIIKKYLKDKADVLKDKSENNKKKIQYEIKDYDNLDIQHKKMKLYDLKADGSKAILEKFKENIRKNSSEFRLLPENFKIENEFKYEAHSILYSDSINKLDSIESFEYDKYKASIYLSKIIYASRLWDKDGENAKKIAKQILNFFKGKLCLEFYSLWEKIFTYFIMKNLKDEFLEFYEYIIKLIYKINDKNKLKIYLREYLEISISIPLALNPKFYDKDMDFKLDKINKRVSSEIKENLNMKLKKKNENKFKQNLVWAIRKSNLIRHTYVFHPLVNYTKLGLNENLDFNLLSKKYLDERKLNIGSLKKAGLSLKDSLKLDKKAKKFSPRFIRFHEVNSFIINRRLFLSGDSKYNNNESNQKSKDLFSGDLEESFKLFYEILPFGDECKNKSEFKKKYFKLGYETRNKNNSKENDLKLDTLKINSDIKKEEVNIAVANMKLSEKNFKDSILQKPNLSSNRKDQLFKLLNLSYQEKIDGKETDILVLPELSVPYSWLHFLADYSRRHQKAIVCGLEHYINRKKVAYNLIVTILPFKVDDYKDSLIKIRIKNHYSPKEKKLLKNYRCTLPKKNQYHYDLFIWKGIYFSCYNCFELADIGHRSLFKSRVDLLIASVYNRDINYFSNIVESVSRDVHCYFVQVNDSNYGDSRITQPSKTYTKDILNIKGGENTVLLLGKINLKSLREFQLKEYTSQDDKLKPPPPDYNREWVKKRMGLKNELN